MTDVFTLVRCFQCDAVQYFFIPHGEQFRFQIDHCHNCETANGIPATVVNKEITTLPNNMDQDFQHCFDDTLEVMKAFNLGTPVFRFLKTIADTNKQILIRFGGISLPARMISSKVQTSKLRLILISGRFA